MGKDVADSVTTDSLLEGLIDAENTEAWARFNARYSPMVIGFAIRLGLTQPDAEDAAQDTLLAFIRGYREGGYVKGKGRLRSWLFGIASRKVADIRRRQFRHRETVLTDRSDGSRLLGKIPDPHVVEATWEAEWNDNNLRICLGHVAAEIEPRTLQAFTQTAIQNCPAAEVAIELGMTVDAVYQAKRRVKMKIREHVAELEQVS